MNCRSDTTERNDRKQSSDILVTFGACVIVRALNKAGDTFGATK